MALGNKKWDKFFKKICSCLKLARVSKTYCQGVYEGAEIEAYRLTNKNDDVKIELLITPIKKDKPFGYVNISQDYFEDDAVNITYYKTNNSKLAKVILEIADKVADIIMDNNIKVYMIEDLEGYDWEDEDVIDMEEYNKVVKIKL